MKKIGKKRLANEKETKNNDDPRFARKIQQNLRMLHVHIPGQKFDMFKILVLRDITEI